jgi:BNR repeat-containing family member
MRIWTCLLATVAAACAAPLEPVVSQTIGISKVSSEFPVGFCLLTTPGRQYVAYYDSERLMTVAARRLDSTEWIYQTLPSKIVWDSHNYVTMAVDGAGHLHVTGNMHCVPLIYFRTEKPGDITSLRPAKMTGELEDRVTYPRFFENHEGRLIFTYRHGGSGNGINLYNRYDTETQTWSRLLDTPLFDGEGKRNAYPAGPTRGPDGWFHVHWVWRDTPDCATNSHLSYARSPDLIHWESAFGQIIDLPVRYDQSALVVDPIPAGGGIINGGHFMEFDSENKPVFVYHKSDSHGNMQICAARPQGGKWRHNSLTEWKHPVPFGGHGTMGFIGIHIGGFDQTASDVFSVSYRHKDYGSGSLQFDARTLELLEKPAAAAAGIPRALDKVESGFPGMEIRRAGDSGTSGAPGVRYLLQWETLGPNRDRPRQPPLPAPSTLRLHKIRTGSS